ncbi:NusG domain II-containing protein [Collinsella intestinalis]|nr:NusG domain II-containing protein [Collinsella intestinalis]MBM6943257.1 NusG domain II-containing protein [Collinsella intestinalis]
MVLAAIVALAALVWFAASALAPASAHTGLTVVCQTREGFYRTDALDADVTYTVTTVEGTNRVSIADGEVDVVAADCDNQVCVEHAPINAPGEQIVCLPHGMVIEVVEDEGDAAHLV